MIDFEATEKFEKEIRAVMKKYNVSLREQYHNDGYYFESNDKEWDEDGIFLSVSDLD